MKTVFAALLCLSAADVFAHDAILPLKEQPQLSRKESVSISQAVSQLTRRDASRSTQIPSDAREKTEGMVDVSGGVAEGTEPGTVSLSELTALTFNRPRRDAEAEEISRLFGYTRSDLSQFGPAIAARYLAREMFRQRVAEALESPRR
jgi:hypothetical protein